MIGKRRIRLTRRDWDKVEQGAEDYRDAVLRTQSGNNTTFAPH
jgi:hypothetical protein